MTTEETPFSGCMSMVLCDLRYVVPQKNICLLTYIYKIKHECTRLRRKDEIKAKNKRKTKTVNSIARHFCKLLQKEVIIG